MSLLLRLLAKDPSRLGRAVRKGAAGIDDRGGFGPLRRAAARPWIDRDGVMRWAG
jgi:hypothetical protein